MLLAATPQGDDVELTEELIAHIEDLEGFSEEAYYDVNGVLTIGFGHTNATKTFKFDEETKIDRRKAEAILLADLLESQKTVKRMLSNRGLTVNQPVMDYMVLVYFNRPWVLRTTMEDIATMNADIAKQSQIDAYEEEKGEAPDWYLGRLDKEFAYINEFDDKTEDGTGPMKNVDPPPPQPPEDDGKTIQEILEPMQDAPSTPLPKENLVTNFFSKIRELFTTAVTKQQEFNDRIYREPFKDMYDKIGGTDGRD
mgnify:FL=1